VNYQSFSLFPFFAPLREVLQKCKPINEGWRKKQTLINGKLSSMGCHERGAGSMERGAGSRERGEERRLEGKNSCGTDGWMIAFGKDD